jgi:prepilin-type N-terminal cleavage/methylation domain-containing protein/prepilin-type processing-associated H-X9-DG protein
MKSGVRRGFTLVELLVVIGIIALLIGILMPALSAAKSQANKLKCQSNMRTIGQTMLIYAGDNHGRVPRDYNYDQQYKDGHIFWAEAFAPSFDKHFPIFTDLSSARDKAMGPYLAKIAVYQCPSSPSPLQPVSYASSSWPITDASTATGSEPMIKITKLKRSSEIVYLIEVNAAKPIDNFDQYDVKDATRLPMDPTGKTIQTNSTVMIDQRHKGNVNILWCDSHVSDKPFKSVTEFDFHPRQGD